MNVVLFVVAVLVVAVVVVLLLAATKPGTYRVERSTTVEAPADAVYDLLTDFHRWPEWSPWEKLDPDMTRTHSGAPAGVGAVYEWSGNKKAGAGRMEITEAVPASAVAIDLQFLKPFRSHNTTRFELDERDGRTDVRWLMDGPMTFATKVMSVFTSMDKMIGKDFEAGLGNLRTAATTS